MLIILGIIVLTVSFVIALISLVVEERKREKLIAEHEEEVAPENVQAEEEIHPRDARLPNLGPQSSLSGEIKIGDISKKQQ